MTRRFFSPCLKAPLTALLLCALATGAMARQRGGIMHDGLARAFLIAPAAAPKAPLVVLLHGGKQDAATVWTQSSLPALGVRDGFTLVAPEAVDGVWNDGRYSLPAGAPDGGIDDVGFILRLIDHVLRETGGDSRRVFLVGASNGGQMVYRIACARADRITGMAPVIAGLFPQPRSWCRPARSVPVIAVNGVSDPLVTFHGGPAKIAPDSVAPHLPQPEALAFWARVNRCRSERTATLPVRVAADPTRVHVTRWGGCAAATVHVAVQGGGHSWPNGPAPGLLGRRLFGATSRQIDAGETIWDFLRNLPPR